MIYDRQALPETIDYFASQGVQLKGKGSWRTGPCSFHGGSDSLRVKVSSGAFICMAGCGAKGGDVLAYHRAAHGLSFTEAVKALGAYQNDGRTYTGSNKPASIPARDLLQMASHDLTILTLLLADSKDEPLTEEDFEVFVRATGRINYVSKVANGLR